MADRADRARTGPVLRGYLLASRLIPALAPRHLRKRLALGKEDPDRWREKLGAATAARPAGRLVWFNAVGLGEVLALRGLIEAMAARDAALSFLVTSSARSSAQVVAANLPERTLHQFLPLDAPAYLARFLDHWRPDLSVWAEQELWPGAVVATARRGIPLALVNARITPEGFARRQRARGLFRDLMSRFARVDAQDDGTAERLRALGAEQVQVSGSLKIAGPPLSAAPEALEAARAALAGRKPWLAASTHDADEAEAIAAMRALADDPAWLLLLVPRDIARAEAVAAELEAAGLPHARRSRGELPGPEHKVWLADSYGELGLWYRLADRALIGGSFDATEGHNPWEAARLGAAILHGPCTANFRADYEALDAAGAARQLAPGELAAALTDEAGLAAMAQKAQALVAQSRDALAPLAGQLLELMERR
ncbi:3-deoxy-D-manno-octulosonic acid transferase [Acidimangrovimonas pyrenivorans]|uniref:3-deoxy-D-manno-octulosonic acid transferase n=1 Tax=Acidimangrovimonas pyrenivorans TaxID=2030798 RepID=A0ABV7AHV0_9RHOB